MNLFTFDGSNNVAFVSSNLFARNQSVDSFAYILRWITTIRQSPEFSSVGAVPVFPTVRPANPIFQFFNNSGFGEIPVFQLATGWYRIRLLTWGICHFCNPWEAPIQQTFIGQNGFPVTAVDDYPEFYFYSPHPELVLNDEIPTNRAYRLSSPPPVKRIPINAAIARGGTYVKASTLNEFTRFVEFSFYVTSPYLFQPVGNFSSDNIANHVGARPGDARYDAFANVGQDNLLQTDPVAPVLYNGAPVTLFVNREKITGIGLVIASLVQDTQYRDIAYT
jgi:hypothetical protein